MSAQASLQGLRGAVEEEKIGKFFEKLENLKVES
jgi:hypothetical protein